MMSSVLFAVWSRVWDNLSRPTACDPWYRACAGGLWRSIDCHMTQMRPTPDQPLRIGTRGSPLALAQA
ncbi:MAG: hypothetical protein VX974_18655, partial [Pseudomonadota bacterium]|nr:hypothetical protein [Pseudomonadota bacterium]